MRTPEILAPAGSIDGLKAAVYSGADAVYMGGSRFGARAFADNPDQNHLLDAIDFVHLYQKKIYLTINTLFKNHELEKELYEYLFPFYEQGLDAVIVQDAGAIRFIHRNFPDLPIHASTQMTLTSAKGAHFLKQYGVTRFVTARELSMEEIRAIREYTKLEIESFVHGALCYSYSGQCLMSSMLGGRSGNRGRCAQICRMPYSLPDKGTGIQHLLSPKDICSLSILPDLIDLGIDSFKIEGRMKRPEYAALTTEKYRKYTDLYLRYGRKDYEKYLNDHEKEWKEDLLELEDIYNRGSFTTGYYLKHNGPDMMAFDRPNHNGVQVGEVIFATKKKAEILLCRDIFAKDLLEFREKETGIYEYTVKTGEISGKKISANVLPNCGVKKGQKVFRIKNEHLLLKIQDKLKKRHKILIKGIAGLEAGKSACLTITDNVHTVKAVGGIVQEALKQPLSPENLKEKLTKTNDTEFEFEELKIHTSGNIFIPIASVNELRRTAISLLRKERIQGYRRKNRVKILENDKEMCETPAETKICVHLENPGLLSVILQTAEVAAVYLDCMWLSTARIKEITSKVRKAGKAFYLVLPHILRESDYKKFIKKVILPLESEKISGYVIKNYEEAALLKQYSNKEIITDYNLYTMNKESKAFWKDAGVTHYTAPAELNEKELEHLEIHDMDLLVYGYLPLMVSAQCVLKNTQECKKTPEELRLEDRYKKSFFVRNICPYCYTLIYNGQPVSLLNQSEQVLKLKPKYLRIDFVREQEEEAKTILKQFIHRFYYNKKDVLESKNYTKGHFKRGID